MKRLAFKEQPKVQQDGRRGVKLQRERSAVVVEGGRGRNILGEAYSKIRSEEVVGQGRLQEWMMLDTCWSNLMVAVVAMHNFLL